MLRLGSDEKQANGFFKIEDTDEIDETRWRQIKTDKKEIDVIRLFFIMHAFEKRFVKENILFFLIKISAG